MGELDLTIFSISGKQFDHFSKRSSKKGPVEIIWNGTDANGNRLPARVYFYQANLNDQHLTGKLLKVNWSMDPKEFVDRGSGKQNNPMHLCSNKSD